jgi:acyl-CoA synthetase (AMP-forming)/AMP-acid ligase II
MSSISDHPAMAGFVAATVQLTSPAAPFELREEQVLGERIQVYVNRPRSLREILDGAASYGDRDVYVFDNGVRIGFGDLVGRVAAVASWLRDAHGIRPGDRVAIGAANGPEWILAFWAVVASGGVVVAMNGWWTAFEMRHGLDLTEPKLVLLDERRRERVGEQHDHRVVALEDVGVPEPAGELPPLSIAEDDPAILIFTSGTTGRPKAAVLTHRSLCAFMMHYRFVAARGQLLSGRTVSSGPPAPGLAVFPLFHVSGLAAVVSPLVNGVARVWPLGRFSPRHVIELTNQFGISAWTGSTTHIARLVSDSAVGTIDSRTVQSISVGGSATTADVIRRAVEQFPHLEGTFSSSYASTETGSVVSHATPWMLAAVPHCIGVPLPGVEIEIRDDDGIRLPDGEDGNICVRSQGTFAGYWRNDEANADTVLPGRWIKTGDVGCREDGIFYLAARKRDLILRGGENVYPFEIENRLMEHPEAAEVAVLGVDHPELGQEVKAVVVLAPGATVDEDQLRRFCAETLSAYKVPSIIEFRSEPLPRNAVGKIMKHVLAGAADDSFIAE